MEVVILNFGPCFVVETADFVWLGVGEVDRPADSGRPGIGESATARWEGIDELLRAGVEIVGLGPPVRAVRLPIEFTLALSSSCCRRLLRMEAASYPPANVSEVERRPEEAEV